MRWLIVGSYPPERGTGAAIAAAFVAERLDAGDEVHVVSPRPSAAHEHRDLVGVDALRWLSQTVSGYDGVWIRIEAGVGFTREPSRWTALLERFLLGRVFRSVGRSVLDAGDLSMLPGGRAGSFVFGPVSEVVAHSTVDRDALVASGASRVRLDHTAAPVAVPSGDPSSEPAPERRPDLAPMPELPVDAGRSVIEAAVRRRASEASVSPPG